ncbi:MAG TPA: N-acetylneuraminate synthase family protein [Rectinemataceae bacterium]|nr:N-acetylneuraminate synthase family protein [Rectinemataceae bacterium]
MGNFHFGDATFSQAAPLVIAEIGTGHGGDGARAADLIAAAAEAGAACAKFQCVFADEIIHPNTGFVPLPGGPTPLFSVFKALERDEDFYAELKRLTEAAGLVFLCTPFGIRSADLLARIGVGAMKVASPELNHLPLLRRLADYRLPTILSSGVSTLGDIEDALDILEGLPVALLHCVTAYPAPPEDYNLRLLASYAKLFGVAVGVSDHSLDPVLVPALAVASGASVVEKHICLSRDDPGLDDPIALDPEAFAKMRRAIDEAARDPEGAIEALNREYGSSLVEATLGSGRKRLAPSEAANYGLTNRSIHALVDIEAGHIIDETNSALLRTEKILRPGLEPGEWPRIVGRRARQAIPAGEGIRWEDLGNLAE